MSSPSDTRHIIRPEHFTVAPQLLGMELARPSRRLTALLIDLAMVSLLVQMAGGWMLALAASYAFFRFAWRSTASGWKRRFMARAVGAVILFTVILNGASAVANYGREMVGDRAAKVAAAGVAPKAAKPKAEDEGPGLGGAVRLTTGIVALRQASSEKEADARAANLVTAMREMGTDEEHIRETLEGFTEESGKPWMGKVVERALPPRPAAAALPAPVPAETLAVRYAAALTARDSVRADSLRPRVASALARDSLKALRSSITGLRGENRALEARAEAAEEAARSTGFLKRLTSLLDDLGIGFGWTGLYFTAFTALWRGQTPGKRLAGVRVVRLDGKPLTFWGSFERFGGYAAGLVTGLLGFAQVCWDRNRQAIHDKISETVVVRERATPAAQPAPRPAALASERRGP